jgi:hypothetical protein
LGRNDFVFERNLVRETRFVGVVVEQNHGLRKNCHHVCKILSIL